MQRIAVMPSGSFPRSFRLLLVLALIVLTGLVQGTAGAQPGGLKSTAETGSLELFLYDCPPGTDPTVDYSDCVPTADPWNLWIAPEDAQVGDALWLLEDAIETDRAAYRFSDLAPGIWDFSPDQDGPDGPVEIVVTGDPTPQPGLWQVEIEAGTESVGSVFRMLPEGYADTGSVTLQVMTCVAGTEPLVDDRDCDPASDPGDVALELVGQSDVQTWTLDTDATEGPDGPWRFADLPVSTRTIVVVPPDETSIVAGGDAYLLGNVTVVDVVGGEDATVILYLVPTA
jgi:hypothetical protein